MSLSATLRPGWLGLLGHPDRAHAALADLLQQLVAAGDDCPDLFSRGDVGVGSLPGRLCGRLQEIARPGMRLQQPLDPAAQLRVGSAGGIAETPASSL